MKSVLITGCNGFLGATLVGYFHNHDWRVFGIDPAAATPFTEPRLADFERKAVHTLTTPPWRVDAIIHLAGASRMADDLTHSHYSHANLDTTIHLRGLYRSTPIYLASTAAMYNEDGLVDHLHSYTETKEEAESYATVALRMGTICGTNPDHKIVSLIDHMLQSAINTGTIKVIDGHRYRAIASLKYICETYLQIITNGHLADRAKKQSKPIIANLYETCHPIQHIAIATLDNLNRIDDWTNSIDDTNPYTLDSVKTDNRNQQVSSIPPDFKHSHISDIRLHRIVLTAWSYTIMPNKILIIGHLYRSNHYRGENEI